VVQGYRGTRVKDVGLREGTGNSRHCDETFIRLHGSIDKIT